MKLLRLQINSDFRSLKAGFELKFRDQSHIEDMQAFRPFCFAGLNGSGKSNVLEALANIFYHLDLCASRFKPKAFESFFDPCVNVNGPNAFELEYMVFSKSDKDNLEGYNLVRVVKEQDSEPKMFQVYQSLVQPEKNQDIEHGQIQIIADKDQKQAANGKAFLPELVVGYSSGENEILSIPFIKSRLIHLDEYAQSFARYGFHGLQFERTESSLVYIDNEMSQAVLLSCLIFEDKETTLQPLLRELNIKRLRSFRMHLNDRILSIETDKGGQMYPNVLQHIHEKIVDLKKIATSWYQEKTEEKGFGDFVEGAETSIMKLDFFVDDEMKKAFRDMFSSALDMFQFFQLLYELNNTFLEMTNSKGGIKEEVYRSEGFYTDGKLPIPGPADKVFFFENYYLEKYINKEKTETKELLLRNFSDGEHQFIHTMGICLLLKDLRTILLLDEPETHFNPDWRSKFISILNESINAGGSNNFMKDVLLTSHSPFIISDCLPNNVFLFKKSKETNEVSVTSAKEMDFKTYGTSVEIILEELFDYDQSIGDLSYSELKVNFDEIKSKEDVRKVKRELRHLGDSIEKDMLYAKLNSMFPDDEGSPSSQNDNPTPDPSSGNPTEIIKQVQNPVEKLLDAIEKASSKKRYQ